jgi:Acyl-CoA dehydrogenase, C-terminal domain
VNFEYSNDQAAVLDALDRLIASRKTVEQRLVVQPFIYDSELESELRDAGFMDMNLSDPESRVAAATVVAEIARLPICVEIAASLFMRQIVGLGVPGPIALIGCHSQLPTRFLPQAKTAFIYLGTDVRLLRLEPGDVTQVSSLFAYPVGSLNQAAVARSEKLPCEVAREVLTWWRIAVALEVHGALSAASALALEHVKQRRQFGRPLGSFQAIQHRLSMNATTIEAIRWMALRAAGSGSALDAALAAGFAQQAINTIVYDVHQFHGAMGLTLEYPLHLYTYRARMLQSELGGGHFQMEAAAALEWPDEAINEKTD